MDAEEGAPYPPPRRQRSFSLPNVRNTVKLMQVLDYNHTEEKLAKILGIDTPTVREVNSAHHEELLLRKRALGTTSQNKRESKKALERLGHDPSREKVKKTLGIDDESVRLIEKERRKEVKSNYQRKRLLSAHTIDKRHAVKALDRLGLDVSIDKAMQVLGVDAEDVRDAYLQELQRKEERIFKERQASAMRDKKHIQKALDVIGYNPSIEKVLGTLGVEAGSDAENAIRSAIPVKEPVLHLQHTTDPSSWFNTSNAVVALSAALLVVVAYSSARKMGM